MEFIKDKNWIWLLPAICSIVTIIASSLATFGCGSVQFTPIYHNNNNNNNNKNNTNNDDNTNSGTIIIEDVYIDPVTNLSWSLEIPPPPILQYAPYLQTSFSFTASINTNTNNTNNNHSTFNNNSSSSNNSNRILVYQNRRNTQTTTTATTTITTNSTQTDGPVATIHVQFLDSCRLIPLDITNIDQAWRYSRIVGLLVPLFGCGSVLMFVLVQPFYPFIGTNEYRLVAFIFLLFGIFQSSTIIFYTKSNACSDYPPLYEQFRFIFTNSLQQQNITTITNLQPFWDGWIQNTYYKQCEWDTGCTWNVIAACFWMITSFTMVWFGPQQIHIISETNPLQVPEVGTTSCTTNI